MPTVYERDDRRQLITVTVTEPFAVEELLDVIDRQSSEDTWEYAMLYDMRSVTVAPSENDLPRMAGRVREIGASRERGPVGVAIRARPALFLSGLMYAKLTRELMTVEVLLTQAQIDAWLARNARS
jgi:hypothetical protein